MTPPYYMIEATLAGNKVSGRWRFLCSAAKKAGCDKWNPIKLSIDSNGRILTVIYFQDPDRLAGANGMVLVKK